MRQSPSFGVERIQGPASPGTRCICSTRCEKVIRHCFEVQRMRRQLFVCSFEVTPSLSQQKCKPLREAIRISPNIHGTRLLCVQQLTRLDSLRSRSSPFTGASDLYDTFRNTSLQGALDQVRTRQSNLGARHAMPLLRSLYSSVMALTFERCWRSSRIITMG